MQNMKGLAAVSLIGLLLNNVRDYVMA